MHLGSHIVPLTFKKGTDKLQVVNVEIEEDIRVSTERGSFVIQHRNKYEDADGEEKWGRWKTKTYHGSVGGVLMALFEELCKRRRPTAAGSWADTLEQCFRYVKEEVEPHFRSLNFLRDPMRTKSGDLLRLSVERSSLFPKKGGGKDRSEWKPIWETGSLEDALVYLVTQTCLNSEDPDASLLRFREELEGALSRIDDQLGKEDEK